MNYKSTSKEFGYCRGAQNGCVSRGLNSFVICQKVDWHFLDEMTNLLNRGQVALQAENRTRLVKPRHKI